MSYIAIYSIYRDVGPPLGDCICHTNHIHPLQYIQSSGPCSGGLYRPYTGPYTACTGMWDLLWPTVYAIHSHKQHIQSGMWRLLGGGGRDSICYIQPYTAYRGLWGLWGLLWWGVHAKNRHIQHIQCCGPCSGGLYMPSTPYTVIYSHIWSHMQAIQGCGTCSGGLHMLYTPCSGVWGLLDGSEYAIYSIYNHIQHIQGCIWCIWQIQTPRVGPTALDMPG